MKNIIIYLTTFLCLFFSKMNAQETFETKAKIIAEKIEKITSEEKAALKTEVEAVNVQLENNSITKEQADEKKNSLAQARATIIETKVAVAQEELKDLVQQKVDGKLQEASKQKLVINFKATRDTIQKSEKRTTTQFVLATGLNNLVTNNQVAHSDFRYLGSHFYEWGWTYNTRIFKNDNLLHAKYGFSLMYNNLRPTDNRFFVNSGNQTNLQTSAINLKDSRFRSVYLVVPAHLEFDFSGNKTRDGGKPFYKTHQSLRLGIGGYAGVNLKSKQILKYEDANQNNVKDRTKGDFNTNDFIYGLSTYIGYKETSLYLKYDLNPMFKDNLVKQNNVSLGIRWDFN